MHMNAQQGEKPHYQDFYYPNRKSRKTQIPSKVAPDTGSECEGSLLVEMNEKSLNQAGPSFKEGKTEKNPNYSRGGAE